MVIRSLLFFFLVVSFKVSSQHTSLELYDISRTGYSLTLINRIAIDSLHTIRGEPSFATTGSLLYFIRQKESGSEVVAYEVATGKYTSVLKSPLHLSHVRTIPGTKNLSFLSRENNRNTLQKFSSDGKMTPIPTDLSLSDYRWLDENVLFAIADGDPNTLQLLTLRPRKAVIVAQHVGSVLRQTPENFYYVHKLSVDSWSIKQIKGDGSISILSETLPEADVFTISSRGDILMIHDGELFMKAKSEWKEVHLGSHRQNAVIKSVGFDGTGEKVFVLFVSQ